MKIVMRALQAHEYLFARAVKWYSNRVELTLGEAQAEVRPGGHTFESDEMKLFQE
jgi:hypothetical protein